MSLRAGSRLGVFDILGSLGAGGMGHVYRARDTRLNRDVAIKVLPALFATDRDRLVRFEREAQTLAALNHPNIAQIYGIVDTPSAIDSPSIPTLVMELVPGEDLTQRIARGPLLWHEAVGLATQIADALDAAHERGIIHRDLKPGNIRVTPDGCVKVLDFGLAKALDPATALAGDDVATITSPAMTGTGVILGTASYMSPEQARGTPLDRRTDIWAFGCVLYEMLSGRRPFTGVTVTDVAAAILTAEPDWTALPVETPPHVRRLLPRLLEKDPKRRARDIADVKYELVTPVVEAEAANRGMARTTRTWQAVSIASIALALSIGAWSLRDVNRTPGAAPVAGSRAIVTQLTNYGGGESDGAIAPDGGSFAYVSSDGTMPDIFRRQRDGGDPVRLTNDPAAESQLMFAPSGETIFYTRQSEGRLEIWRVGALGGNARKVVENAQAPAVSRDGRRLAWLEREPTGRFSLVVAAVDGANARPLLRGLEFQPPVPPAWSPDSRFLAYSSGGLFQPRNLSIVDVNDGTVRQVTRFDKAGQGPTMQSWLSDGRRLLVSYWAESRAQLVTDLGILDVEIGEISRLTMNVAESFLGPSLSADGTRAIATASRVEREVWKVPDGPDPLANGKRAERLVDASFDPMWTYVSRDGSTLLYNNSIVGSRNLWLWFLDRSGPPRQVTSISGDRVMHSSLSPDGTRVAFISSANGHADVWVQHVDGSGLKPLTNDVVPNSWPVWSPDGTAIMFSAGRAIMTIPANGGEPRKVMDGFFRGDWVTRPDGGGTWAVSSIEGEGGVRLIDVENGAELWREPNATGYSLPMFNRDGSAFSVPFPDGTDRYGIAVVDTATRQRRIAVRFAEPFQIMFRASWIDGDRAFAVNRQRTRSHIVMFDGLLPAARTP